MLEHTQYSSRYIIIIYKIIKNKNRNTDAIVIHLERIIDKRIYSKATVGESIDIDCSYETYMYHLDLHKALCK